jgi:hypothetical protein
VGVGWIGGAGSRHSRSAKLSQTLFQPRDLHLAQGSSQGRFARDATTGRLEGGYQRRGMGGRPLGDGRDTPLLAQQGASNDGQDKAPFQLLAACLARIGYST